MAPQETVSVISRCYLSTVLFRWHHAALHRTRRYLSSPAALGRSRLTKWLNVAHYSLEIPAPGFLAPGRPPSNSSNTVAPPTPVSLRLYLPVTWVNTLASLTSKPFCLGMSSSCGVSAENFTISVHLPGGSLFFPVALVRCWQQDVRIVLLICRLSRLSQDILFYR